MLNDIAVWDARSGPEAQSRSIISMRFIDEHVARRKRWIRAFSTVSVKNYEPIVIKRALQLVDELQRRSTKGDSSSENYIDLAQWLSYFT